MKPRLWFGCLAAGLLALAGCAGSATVDPASALDDIGAGLKGPPGLKAAVAAGGLPSVAAVAVDGQHRLWASTAAFEDTGNDAVFVVPAAGGAPVKVIAGLHTPLGLLWLQDTLYVASASGVDTYRGFDGTSFAEHHLIVALDANAGRPGALVLGPDGRLVMGVSAPCDSCVPTSMYSAAIVSFEPDGRDVRIVARGIRAPVGLAYYPGTADLFVSMNQRDDLGDRTPGDWLAAVHDGDDWRFPNCYGQGGADCTDVPAPIAVLDPHAAVSDVAVVSGQLGATVATSAIVAEWAVGKVQRVALTKTDSGYRGTVVPFLQGVQSPVAVLLDATTLYVGDWTTGTVYAVTAA